MWNIFKVDAVNGVLLVNFEHISHLFLVFLVLLTWNMYLLAMMEGFPQEKLLCINFAKTSQPFTTHLHTIPWHTQGNWSNSNLNAVMYQYDQCSPRQRKVCRCVPANIGSIKNCSPSVWFNVSKIDLQAIMLIYHLNTI